MTMTFRIPPNHSRRLSLLCTVLLLAFLLGGALTATAQDLEAQATAAYYAGDYAQSAKLFLQAIEAGSTDASLRYNAACALALDGQADAAMTQLEGAIHNGFSNTNQMQKDPDLQSLRTRADWSELLGQAKVAQQLEEMHWGTDTFSTPYKPQISEQEKQIGLTLIWAEARYGFANFDLAPDSLDWNARYVEFMPRVSKAKTTIDYYLQLQAFISGLHDGHSSVTFPLEIRSSLYSWPAMRTERLSEEVVVTQVYDPSLPVHVGDVIKSIDGQAVDEYAESQVAPYQCYSTPQDRDVRVYDYGLLYGPADESLKLELVDAAGASRTVEISRRTQSSSPRKANPPFKLSWEPHDIAYIQLKSFGSIETADLWHQHYDEIHKRARGIVFDVRNNGGGGSNVGYEVISDLIDETTRASSQELTVYRATLRAWGRGQQHDVPLISSVSPSNRPHFEAPVAVLIGPRTYSAAEDFVVAFDMADRGALIGTATGGSTGQPLSFALPGGGSARVCTKRDRYADGREFVGVGIKPDIEVRQTLESIRAGKDLALQRALEWIEEKL